MIFKLIAGYSCECFLENSLRENRIPAAQPRPILANNSSSSRLNEGSMENVVSTLFSFFGLLVSFEKSCFAFCPLILLSCTTSLSGSGFLFKAMTISKYLC